MIDSHSHILPGLDDGAKTLADALAIVRQLSESGFQTLIATPHVLEGTEVLSPSDILAVTDQVRRLVAEAGIPIDILPGAENYIFPEMAQWVRAGKLLTLGNAGKYLLVELPMLEIPRYTDQVFFELQVLGVTPVLAHPERNRGIAKNPERLVEWARRGILLQLDLRSLSGKYGPQAQELAERLLYSDLIHLVGSDAHRVARQPLAYREDLQRVQEIVGEERFRELTLVNPEAVIAGASLPRGEERGYGLKEAVAGKRKRGFWRLFGWWRR